MEESRLSITRARKQFVDQENDADASLRFRVNALEQSIATIKATISILLAGKQGDMGHSCQSPSSFINRLMSASEKSNNNNAMIHIKIDELSRKYNSLEKEMQSMNHAINTTVMQAVSLNKNRSNNHQITDSDIENMFGQSNDRNKRTISALTHKMNVC